MQVPAKGGGFGANYVLTRVCNVSGLEKPQTRVCRRVSKAERKRAPFRAFNLSQKLKNRWGSDLHTVVTRVADRIPAYVVKNNCTGKKKVVHRARLLLWLADYGEPVRCNHVDTSDVPTGTATGRNPQTGCDGDNSVPGCSLQYGMDLTVYMAIIEDPERMSSRIGREVRTGAPRNVAGQMIVKPDEEECPDCLGSYSEDVPCG